MAKIENTVIGKTGKFYTEDDFLRMRTQLQQKDAQIRTLENERLTEEALMNTMKDSMLSLPKVKVDPYKGKVLRPGHEEDQILLFSDLHAGEIIRKEEVDGFNEYNFEIMCRRLWHLSESILSINDLHSNAYKVKRLWVLSLGDIVTGEIHNMAETNEFPILSTIQQTALIISQFLIRLASRYEEIQYVAVAGNHDRRHEKPRTKGAYDNWATMVNWAVSVLCANQPNIKFHCPKSQFLIVDIRNWKWLVRHGHDKVNSLAGIPFYGISKKASSYQSLFRKRGGYDYSAIGHYHQQTQLNDDRLFVNGSVIGANEYAICDLAAYSPPSQKLIGIDDHHGVTYTYKLTLQEADVKPHEFVYDPNSVFEHQAHMASFLNKKFDKKAGYR